MQSNLQSGQIVDRGDKVVIRRPIRTLNNPMLQRALILSQQRNPNAAVQGLQNRGIYSRFAAQDAANALASTRFSNAYNARNRRMADTMRHHNMTSALKWKAMHDARKGGNIGKALGLVQLGLGWQGNRDAAKARAEASVQNRMITENLLSNAPESSMGKYWEMLPQYRNFIERSRHTFNYNVPK